MIIEGRDLLDGSELVAEVVVVGAGPAGITVALELGRRGVDVILVESGKRGYDPQVQQLSDAAHWSEDLHAPMSLAVRRQIGGTSTVWGGRCVPYDPVDFRERDFVPNSRWPVTYGDLEPYFQRASDWMQTGRAAFDLRELPHLTKELVPGLTDDGVTTSSLERWSLPTDFGKVYYEEIRRSPNVRLVTGFVCTKVLTRMGSDRADGISCKRIGGGSIEIRAHAVVVSGGGLESTRLLMESEAPSGGELGNHSGHLGRWYMGHLEGVIARLEFNTDPRRTIYDYEQDRDGVYVRRRFTFTERFQVEHRLPNISGWLANPELADASHGDARLSFTYLALTSPLGPLLAPPAQRLSLSGTRVPGAPYGVTEISPPGAHLRNVLRHPLDAASFIAGFGSKRFLARRRRAPGFFVYNPHNVYRLQYHGEHLPAWASRVTLAREVDAVGMRRLEIDIRFSDADFEGVVQAHRYWEEHLRRTGVGRLRFLRADPLEDVRSRSGGGFHQVGTTRMADDPKNGVVDKNLRIFGVDNVYVASSSTFVTSGQANSTFMVVAFAVRLADHLVGGLRRASALPRGSRPQVARLAEPPSVR
jgi:choline dehydrogenase-like flavoprotein